MRERWDIIAVVYFDYHLFQSMGQAVFTFTPVPAIVLADQRMKLIITAAPMQISVDTEEATAIMIIIVLETLSVEKTTVLSNLLAGMISIAAQVI